MVRSGGKKAEVVTRLRAAADLEDASEKYITMENRLFPMRALLDQTATR